MGLFGKKEVTPEEQANRQREVERKQAELRAQFRADDKVERFAGRLNKFPVEGARMVAHAGTFQMQCLILRDEQVEYYTKEGGSIGRSTAVTRQWTVSGDQVLEVSCDPPAPADFQRAITAQSKLLLVTSAGSVHIKGRALQLEYMAELIAGLQRDAPTAAPATEAVGSPSARDALKSLTELKEDGLITDDEYQSKRAEIIARM